ncbi:hypothetical protein GCM10010401_18850 [Rarobacter faecitabidus]
MLTASAAGALVLQLGIAVSVPTSSIAAAGDRVASQKTVNGRTVSLVVNDASGEIRSVVTGAQNGDKAWLDRSVNGFTNWTLINYTDSVSGGTLTTGAASDKVGSQYALLRACAEAGGQTDCTPVGEASRTQLGDVLAATNGLEAYWGNSSKLYDTDPTGTQPTNAWIKWWHSAVATSALAATVRATRDESYLTKLDTIFESNKNKDESGIGKDTFRNKYIDDTGWWAMAWIDTYRLTGNEKYLTAATTAAQFMSTYPGTCGGVLWHTDATYHAAISNGLYLQVASALYSETGDQLWKNRAQTQWQWYANSGLITADGRVVDGVSASNCTAGGGVYTYNQGVLLSALVEYYHATDDASVLGVARTVADRFTTNTGLNTAASLGVMRDSCESGTGGGNGQYGYPCSNDGPTFKGPAVRGLAELNAELSDKPYTAYLDKQRTSALKYARNATKSPGTDQYGLRWWDSGADKQHIGNQVAAVMLLANTYTVPDVAPAPLEAPSITLSPASPGTNGWFTTPVAATISATDLPSGAVVEYALATGEWHVYDGPITLTEGSGSHLYARVRSDSHSPSTSGITAVSFAIDATAPASDAAFDPAERLVTITTTDTRSGVASVEYRIGTGEWIAYSAPFSPGDASTTVYYRASDQAGNVTSVKSLGITKKRADGELIRSEVRISSTTQKVAYGTQVRVTVTVLTDEPSVSSSGRVEVRDDAGVIGSAAIVAGRATIALPRSLRPGYHSFTATYLGDTATYSSSAGFGLQVVKTGARISVTAPKKIKRAKRATVKVAVKSSTGVSAAGKVKVVVTKGKRKVIAKTIKVGASGVKSLKLKRLKAGKYKIKVTYQGSSTVGKKAAAAKKLTVRK